MNVLTQDPRVIQAKEMILEALKEKQQTINGIRGATPEKTQTYEDLLQSFQNSRGSKLWFPYIGSGFGSGPFVELMDGSVKYDFISGIGPHLLGHCHPDLVSCMVDAALSNTVMQGNLQQNEDSLRLCELLIKISEIDHCFLTTSGSMANENALKVIFQKRYPANRILAFSRNFSGRTWALSQVTDKPAYREGIPSNIPVDYIPFYDAKRPEESIEQAITLLKSYLKRYPKQYACMHFELVQGESGFFPGSREFFIPLMEMLREQHVSILVDEVQTFGRTPSLFAFQHFGLDKYVDVVTIGKLSQVCATLFRKDHNPKPGLLSQTFTSSTAAIRAALFIIENLLQGGYFGPEGKNMKLHHHFVKNLTNLAQKNPDKIQGPFGYGAMIAFTPYDGTLDRTTQFIKKLFDAGVISFIGGTNPSRVRFLVPTGVTTTEHIDQVTQIIGANL